MYSALEKLYGLKLFDGLITEDRIPVRFKDNAIAYAESLKPVEVEPEQSETPEVDVPDNTETETSPEEGTPEAPETDSETETEDTNENTQAPEETPEINESETNGGTSEEVETPSEETEEETETDSEETEEIVPPVEETETPEEVETPEEPVAKLSLQEMIDNAEAGATVTLTEDISLTDPIATNKEITIDLNGYNITSEANVIYLRSDNANVTVTGEGNVTGGSGGNFVAARVQAGTLNINGGTWTVGPDAEGLGNSCIYASASGTVNINGGEFSTAVPYNGNYFVLNKKDNSEAVINVTGGMFHNFDPSNNGSEGTGTNFVVDGYVSTANEDSTIYTVTIAA